MRLLVTMIGLDFSTDQSVTWALQFESKFSVICINYELAGLNLCGSYLFHRFFILKNNKPHNWISLVT